MCIVDVTIVLLFVTFEKNTALSALMLLVGRQEEHLACRN